MKSGLGDALDLDKLKRSELQKLAKKYGIKANLRNAKLIEELTEKLSQTTSPNSSSPTLTKRRSHSAKKSFSEDVVTLESISPPPLAELSFDDLKVDETKATVQTKKSSSGSRSSSRTRAGKDVGSSAADQEHSVNKIKSVNVTRRSEAQKVNGSRVTRSRSSSQNRAEKTPSSSKQKKTPSNKAELRKVVNTKTFSVPKNRTQARLSSSVKEKPASIKKTAKRKSSVAAEQPPVAKRGRVSTRKSKEDRESGKDSAEKNVGRATGLHNFNAKNIPSFAVKGLTVPKVYSTPSMFEKVHQNKMESIDDYQKRKEERIEKLFGSNKKQAQINRLAKPKTPSIVKPVMRPKPNFMSPKAKVLPTTKKSSGRPAAFKPAVTKVADINTNFGSKRSKLATPKRVAVSFAKSAEKKIAKVQTPAHSTQLQSKRKSGTPFRQNTSIVNTPQSAKKSVFDLQESLKKPLSWKPHKGPLKKYEDTTKKPTFKDRAKVLKQPKLTSREARRAQAKEARATSRSDRLMKKRGLK